MFEIDLTVREEFDNPDSMGTLTWSRREHKMKCRTLIVQKETKLTNPSNRLRIRQSNNSMERGERQELL